MCVCVVVFVFSCRFSHEGWTKVEKKLMCELFSSVKLGLGFDGRGFS